MKLGNIKSFFLHFVKISYTRNEQDILNDRIEVDPISIFNLRNVDR